MSRMMCIALAALLWVGCDKEPRFYVEGHVFEEGSGEVVSNARLNLYESDCFIGCTEHLVTTGTTNSNGYFRIILEETSSLMSLGASSGTHFSGDREIITFEDGKAVTDCQVIPKAWVRYIFTGLPNYSYAFLHTNRRDLNHPQQLGTFISSGLQDTTAWMEVYGAISSEFGVYVTTSQGSPDSSFQWQVLAPAFDSTTFLAPF